MGLSSGELEFFLGLVDLGRAGTSTLKEHIRNRLNEFRGESKKLKKILPQSEKTMSEADQAIFYSKWQYIGVLLLASLESGCSFDEMVARLGLNNSSVAEITDFLVSRGLIFNRSGRFEMVVGRTHLPSDSKLVSRHHTNWRLKAIQKHESLGDDELAYSGPVSLSEEDFLKVRDRIISLIKEVVETAVDSKAQKLACLNIDWFEF